MLTVKRVQTGAFFLNYGSSDDEASLLPTVTEVKQMYPNVKCIFTPLHPHLNC